MHFKFNYWKQNLISSVSKTINIIGEIQHKCNVLPEMFHLPTNAHINLNFAKNSTPHYKRRHVISHFLTNVSYVVAI